MHGALQVLDVATQLAGEIRGLSFISGLLKWPLHEQYGTRPFPPHLFREKATALHRRFLSLFVSSFLRVVRYADHPLTNSQYAFCLSCWFTQLLEMQPGLLSYYGTRMLSHLPELRDVFEGVNWREPLRDGSVHSATWDVTETILQKLAAREKSAVIMITQRMHQV